MANYCGTDHHEEILEPRYLELIDRLVYHMDQPIGDFSIFPTYLVSNIARKYVKVVLSGDGGDELFAGYDTYVANRLANWTVDRIPDRLMTLLQYLAGHIPVTSAKKGLWNRLRFFTECAGMPSKWQHMRWMVFLTPEQKQKLYQPEFCEAVSKQAEQIIMQYLDGYDGDHLNCQLFCDFQFYLSENILPKVDLMSMATSLETRVPYLDNEVIALVLSMPGRLKWRGFERKYILKKAYRQELPPAILTRKKEGFSIPLKSWLNNEWNTLMHDVLSETALKNDGLFNPKTIDKIIQEHETHQANHSHILWSLMIFKLWQRKYMSNGHAASII
jgi:asparagine synthase (glutamine-hydrolysing)